MLYQQCLNRLSKVQGTTITEEALLEVPGFSEFVLSQIQNRMDYPPRKRKADESVPSKPAKKRQSGSDFVDEDDNGLQILQILGKDLNRNRDLEPLQ